MIGQSHPAAELKFQVLTLFLSVCLLILYSHSDGGLKVQLGAFLISADLKMLLCLPRQPAYGPESFLRLSLLREKCVCGCV